MAMRTLKFKQLKKKNTELEVFKQGVCKEDKGESDVEFLQVRRIMTVKKYLVEKTGMQILGNL